MTDGRKTLSLAVRSLASVCDGAFQDDGQGFNKPDTNYGHAMAARPINLWTPGDTYGVWQMLRKYKAQLDGYGIDYDSIPEPPKVEQNGNRWQHDELCVLLHGDHFVVRMPYNDIKSRESFKATVPGRRWDRDERCWTVPQESGIALMLWTDAVHAYVSPEALPVMKAAPDKFVETEETAPDRTVVLDNGRLTIRFPYNPDLVHSVKRLDGRRWDKDRKVWTVPMTLATVQAVQAFAQDNDFSIDDETRRALDAITKDAETRAKASQASDCDLHVDGLGGTLRPFQRAGVAYAINAERAFISDAMGCGKTCEALAAMQATAAFPTVVVCPASVKLNWKIEAEKWLPDKTIAIANGTVPTDADVVITNYAMLSKQVDALVALKPAAVVLDESTACKNTKAQRTKAAMKLASRARYRWLLSGTPIMNRPAELVSQLKILGRLDEFGGWYKFVTRYCAAYKNRWGWDVSGASHLDELAMRLRQTCFVRREKKDVLSELPDKQRTVLPVQLDDRKAYNRDTADAISWLVEQKAKDDEFIDSIAHLSPDDRKKAIAQFKASAEWRARQAEILVRIEALKQITAEHKMPAVLDWIADFLETGEKLIVFSTHKSVQQKIMTQYPDAVHVFGSDDAETRQLSIERFQNDDDCRLIVCSIKAGGMGITLTAASNVAIIELPWTPADLEQAEDRAHRIGQDNAVNVWYLLAEKTIDMQIWDLLQSKQSVTTAATQSVTTALINNVLAGILK